MCSELPPVELFAEIARRHGHRCPMSTLGGRLGFAARRRLPAGRVRGIYFADTCAVDGVLAAAGCERRQDSLLVQDEARHALLLFAGAEDAVEVELRPRALEIAWEYRRVNAALEQDRPTLDGAELAEREAQRDVVLDDVLKRLRSAEESLLVAVKTLSEKRRMALWEELHA